MPADPDLLAQLRPVRLPPELQAFAWPDVFAAVALGILAALVLLAVLRLATRRQETPLAIARRKLAAAKDLPTDKRLFRQAVLLDRLSTGKEQASRRPANTATALTRAKAAIGDALYRPGGANDPDAIDTAILTFAGSLPRSGRGA
ncbi:hypothetical protein GTW51_01400 [Aurantimonas aggregata]|uniref:DUF4381 family protein n=1 Tax=Aurantimonas aggregata TaxID=2047720 RepID=A0A6L9MCE1_9HYPH|nr:hypothetical protein [Aurantimonas aggregata]NDV85350.1 hypothetical protein [Aurantimonas aggregata]